MRKLKMDLDELMVESFETAAESAERGTVHGHLSIRCDTVNATCDDANTCGGDTCNFAQNTCADSCGICGTYLCPSVAPLTGDCGQATPFCTFAYDGGCVYA
jgi:hypothetical protein